MAKRISHRGFWALVVCLLALCATAYVLVLHLTGFVHDAKGFATYAAGGLGSLLLVVWFFGGLNDG